MRSLSLFFLLLLAAGVAASDEIVLKGGAVYRGTVTGATRDSVWIETEGGVVRLAQGDVLTILFTNSDVLSLTGDRTVQCKIVRKEGTRVVIVTPEGVRSVENSEVERVQYNSGAEIRVAGLPETGRQYENDSGRRVWSGERMASFYGRIRLAAHYASLSKWKSQFSFSGGEGSPSSGFMIGGELGYAFKDILQIGAGYEYFSTRDVNIQDVTPSVTDGVHSTFLYGGVRAGGFLSSIPRLYLYGSLDAGPLTATEKITSADGITLEGSGTAFAFRVGGGCEYYLSGNLTTSAEIDYLIGNVTDVRVTGMNVQGYELDCSGVTFLISFSYHIPTH